MPRRFILFCLPLLLSAASIAQNSVPTINMPVVPMSVRPGSPGFSLIVNGTGFVPNSVVNWNGTPRNTEFISEIQLTAAISASDVEKQGTARVTVTNPSPGGGTSALAFLHITDPTLNVTWTRSDFATAANPRSIITADFNKDGKLDLATANDVFDGSLYQGYVSVLLGDGQGSFLPNVDYHEGVNSWRVASADFNGDGFLDLVVVNTWYWTSTWWREAVILLGNGDGTFREGNRYNLAENTEFVKTGDFNGDGNVDFAVGGLSITWGTCIGSCPLPGTFEIFLGDGTGGFIRKAIYPTNDGPRDAVVADFNRDNKLDLAISNDGPSINGSHASTVSIFLGNGDGTFNMATDYPVDWNPMSIADADFNGDGIVDLVTANAASGTLSVLMGDGTGHFLSHSEIPSGSAYMRQPWGLSVGDFDGDNKVDVAAVNAGSSTVSLFLGRGDGTFKPFIEYDSMRPLSTESLVAGDFDGDGRLDLAVTNTNGTVAILRQNSISANRPPKAIVVPSQIVECTAPTGSLVVLDGTKSYDPDGLSLTFEWRNAQGRLVGSNATANVVVPLGTSIFTLTVKDPSGLSDVASTQVTVRDTTPPQLTVTLLPNVLWPPNNKLIYVEANVVAADICDPHPAVTLVSILNSEPDSGAGDIQAAAFGTDDRTFQLRATRSGRSTGRVYTATYLATDQSGNAAQATAKVLVPHDNRATE